MAEAVGPAVTTKWVVQKNAVALAAAPGFVDTKNAGALAAAPGFRRYKKTPWHWPRRPAFVDTKTPRHWPRRPAFVDTKKRRGIGRGVFHSNDRIDYFDTAFLNARSIFSLVASQQAWLA